VVQSDGGEEVYSVDENAMEKRPPRTVKLPERCEDYYMYAVVIKATLDSTA